MKFCILLFHLILTICFACQNGQNTEGVSDPQIFLKKRFPKAQDILWDTTAHGTTAYFAVEAYDCTAYFDKNGQFQYATTLIEEESLPQPAQKLLNEKYKDATSALILCVENDKTKTYQVELETEADYITLEFDAKGKALKEVKLPLSKDELERQESEGVEKE